MAENINKTKKPGQTLIGYQIPKFKDIKIF